MIAKIYTAIAVIHFVAVHANASTGTCRTNLNSARLFRGWLAANYAGQCAAVAVAAADVEQLDTNLEQGPLFSVAQLQWSDEEVTRTAAAEADTHFGRLDEFHAVIEALSCPASERANAVSRYANLTDDPLFPAQWYLHDCRMSENELQYDINVVPVWREGNFGQGVRIMIIDDGVETTHDDITDNYDSNYGLDLIERDHTPDPRHVRSSHGTRSAGVIAMKYNNAICGVGIAPAATLGAVRLLAPRIRPAYEDMIQALVFRMHDVHITSNSWSVNDDGQQMPYPDVLLRTAFKATALEGRRGKGVIHVFSAGNGKPAGDMCGCDLLINAIETIAVASCDHRGRLNTYSERCAAVMVTAYSGDGSTPYNVVSATTNNACTINHTGTSAATPMVAGVIALALHANPHLTWRDVQHLLTRTSRVAPLRQNPGWRRNAAGLHVSEDFGFGLINAHRLVEEAKTFRPVPAMSTCAVPVPLSNHDRSFNRFRGSRIQFESEGCWRTPMEINFTEHVQLRMLLTYSRRGDLEIGLTSPGGTYAQLLEARMWDDSDEGLRGWTFDSVTFWGESPRGLWTVDVYDQTGSSANEGRITELSLIVYGTKEKPNHYD